MFPGPCHLLYMSCNNMISQNIFILNCLLKSIFHLFAHFPNRSRSFCNLTQHSALCTTPHHHLCCWHPYTPYHAPNIPIQVPNIAAKQQCTPMVMIFQSAKQPSTTTHCLLPIRQFCFQFASSPSIPCDLIF